MSTYSRRVITSYIDVENSARRNVVGETFYTPTQMTLLVSQQILFQFHLLLGDGATYFKVPPGTAWYFGVDDTFGAKPDIIQVGNVDFVESDWEEADFTNGKVCWRVDLTASDLIEDISDTQAKNYTAGLWMMPPGEKPVCLCEWDVTIRNIATYQVEPEEQEGVTFVTTDMLGGFLKKQEPRAHIRVGNDGIMYRWCSDDSLWYPEGVRLVDGKPVITLGETGIEEVP